MPPINVPDLGDNEVYWLENPAVFKADMVRFLEEESNWSRATLEADPEVTFAHVREFSRRRLVDYLKTVPDIQTQDLSDQRVVLHHIAHVATAMSGSMLHANDYPEERWLKEFRQSLHFIAQEKRMIARSDSDPIQSHWKKKSEMITVNGGSHRLYTLKADEKDAAIAWHFLGENSSPIMNISLTRERIAAAIPFLTETDGTYLDHRLKGIREEILRVFEGRSAVYPFDKNRAISLLREHWIAVKDSQNELNKTLEALTDDIWLEWMGKEEFIDLDDDPVERVLRLAFEKLIGEEAPKLDDAGKKELLKRRLILEFLILREAEKNEKEDTMPAIKKIAQMYQRYHLALGTRLGDNGHLDLAIALIGAQSLPQLRSMLH